MKTIVIQIQGDLGLEKQRASFYINKSLVEILQSLSQKLNMSASELLEYILLKQFSLSETAVNISVEQSA